MKANELRIGNLILVDYFSNIAQTAIFTGYDPNEDVYYFKKEDGEIDYYLVSGFQPIPLTEEWLVRFGFIYGILQLKTPDKTLNISAIINGKYYMYLDDVFGNSFDLNYIEYVHQLQNLYFVLTGEELTVE